MADYRKMYSKMYNSETDAERMLQNAMTTLRTAQQECEELFIEADGTHLTCRTSQKNKKIYAAHSEGMCCICM